MLRIAKPTVAAEVVYRACVSSVQDGDLKQRLLAVSSHVEAAADKLEYLLGQGRVHSMQPITDEELTALGVTRDELTALYASRMVKKGGRCRPIYDALLAAAPLGVCPLCAHRDVSTLDHYLPKGQFADLSVTPINLVPACKDCNFAKLEGRPSGREEETLHPYFDNVDDETWLVAQLRPTSPATVTFEVRPPAHWPEVERDRLRYHFRVFRLARLYGAQSAVELVNMRFQLKLLHRAGGSEAVRAQLSEREQSYAHVRRNSWQSALFSALAMSSWYCNGGFAT
jgi:hypothetical protein